MHAGGFFGYTMVMEKQTLREFEQDKKHRHEYVEKQNKIIKEKADKAAQEEFELKENTYENVVRSLEKIDRPIHRNTFTFPYPLYKDQKK